MYRFLWLFFSKKKRTSNTYLLVVCAPIAGLVPGTMPVGANFSFQRARKKGGGGFFHAPRFLFHLLDLLEKDSMVSGRRRGRHKGSSGGYRFSPI